MKNTGIRDFFIFALCLIAGMLLGRIISQNWNKEVNNKVDKILSQVVMLDVPIIDEEIGLFLANNEYNIKYLTAVDVATLDYGIYEVEENGVVAYAHGKCQSVGDVQPGTYKIVKTKSHLDYKDVRYWYVVYLKEIHTGEELIVSTPGYKIADAPVELSEQKTDLGNIEIGSEIMLTVYENGVEGTTLLVVDSENGALFNGKGHLH